MYTLKILSEQDFDKLPYKHAKRSLGLADAKTGVAFVRDTGYNDITKATISHELDELVANVSPHEEDGIRYKSLASLGAGAGAGALSSMIPGLKNISPLISAGAGALANRKGEPLKGALQGFAGGGAGSALLGGGKSAIQGLTQPGGTFGKAFSSFIPGAKQAGLDFAGAIPGMKGIGTDQPVGALAKFLTPSTAQQAVKLSTQGGGGGALSAFGGGAPTPEGYTGTVTVPGTRGGMALPSVLQAKGGTGSILDKFKESLPSIGAALAGELFAPKVEVPDFAGVGQDLQSKLQAGELGEPVAKELGMNELQRVLGQPLGEVPSTAFTLGDLENQEAKTKALQQYTNHWKSIRPGADFQNDPAFQQGYTELEEQYDRIRTAQRDEKAFEYTQQQLQQKYQYMVQALGVDQYQMQQYIQLAQLEVDQLMAEFELSAGEAEAFKQMFGDLAQMMAPQQDTGIGDILSQFGLGGQANA